MASSGGSKSPPTVTFQGAKTEATADSSNLFSPVSPTALFYERIPQQTITPSFYDTPGMPTIVSPEPEDHGDRRRNSTTDISGAPTPGYLADPRMSLGGPNMLNIGRRRSSIDSDYSPSFTFRGSLSHRSSSMWSELIRLKDSDETTELGSPKGNNSPSDGKATGSSGSGSVPKVSERVNVRLKTLAKAFSKRTQVIKEKIVEDLSPASSTEDLREESSSKVTLSSDEIQKPELIPRSWSSMPTSSAELSDQQISDNPALRRLHAIKRTLCPGDRAVFIDPRSKVYLAWLFFMTLLFAYNAVGIFLRSTFPYQTEENKRYWLMADYVADGMYLLDIILVRSRVTYLTSNGTPERNRRKIFINYVMKSNFKLDVLSLLPMDLFYLVVGVKPLLRMPRLLKFQTFGEFFDRLDRIIIKGHFVRVIRVWILMLYLIHLEACGYYAASDYENFSTTWTYKPGNWNAYIRCFLMATKTATSIGKNVRPTNSFEMFFMSVYWYSGVLVFAILISQIRDIYSKANASKDKYRKRMDTTMAYLKELNVPTHLRDKVRLWFDYNWNMYKTVDELDLLKDIPMKLQADLAMDVHYETLMKVKMFQDCDRSLLYDLLLKLRPVLYLPGDYICVKDEIGKEMYILDSGVVEVVGDDGFILAVLKKGSVIGEISLLGIAGSNRRTATVRSKGYSSLFVLSKDDFNGAMKDYPEALDMLQKRAKRLLRKNKQSTAERERQDADAEANIIIKADLEKPPMSPRMADAVVQVMSPDSLMGRMLRPRCRSLFVNRKAIKFSQEPRSFSEEVANTHEQNLDAQVRLSLGQIKHSKLLMKRLAHEVLTEMSVDIPDTPAQCPEIEVEGASRASWLSRSVSAPNPNVGVEATPRFVMIPPTPIDSRRPSEEDALADTPSLFSFKVAASSGERYDEGDLSSPEQAYKVHPARHSLQVISTTAGESTDAPPERKSLQHFPNVSIFSTGSGSNSSAVADFSSREDTGPDISSGKYVSEEGEPQSKPSETGKGGCGISLYRRRKVGISDSPNLTINIGNNNNA